MSEQLGRALAQPASPASLQDESRAMFVARIGSGDQDTMMSCRDVLALLSDCDYLAALATGPVEAQEQPAGEACTEGCEFARNVGLAPEHSCTPGNCLYRDFSEAFGRPQAASLPTGPREGNIAQAIMLAKRLDLIDAEPGQMRAIVALLQCA